MISVWERFHCVNITIQSWGMSRISGLRNDINKRTFYKERKIKQKMYSVSKKSITSSTNSGHVWQSFVNISYWYLVRNTMSKISSLNPLTAKDEISRPENLTFLCSWILRWVPRSTVTDAPLCNTLFSNNNV